MQTELLTLQPGRWYAWEMIPGYTTELDPYHSPILIHSISPRKSGLGDLSISFFNAFYAEGVQDCSLQLRVLKRTSNFLLVDIRDNSGPTNRAALIGNLSLVWLERFAPQLLRARPVQAFGNFDSRNLDPYLNWAHSINPSR